MARDKVLEAVKLIKTGEIESDRGVVGRSRSVWLIVAIVLAVKNLPGGERDQAIGIGPGRTFSTSASYVATPAESRLRKCRSFVDGVAKGQIDPFLPLRSGP
jgi:hypothetical protein